MDTLSAIKLSQDYLKKVRNSKIDYSEAWMFGSYATGNFNENSDIDIAISLRNQDVNFETEVKLMLLRDGEETIIEPHIFDNNDFRSDINVIKQILNKGIKLDS